MAWRPDDPRLYEALTTGELLRSLTNLQMLACDPVVSLTARLLNSDAIHKNPLIRAPAFWALRRLAFAHFCAGEDLSEASDTLASLWHRLRLQGILNFALEDAPDDASCDANLQVFLDTVRYSHKLPDESVSFACVKITAICPVPLLEHVSVLLRSQHKNSNLQLPWQEDNFPVFSPESPIFNATDTPEPLTLDEEQSWFKAKGRLWQLCEESRKAGVPLLVDAEYSSVQPAIEYLTYAATLHFNKPGEGGTLVYNTVQAYLKDSFPRLKLAVDSAYKRGIPLGIKLVRGAYIVRETALASSLNVPSPIHPTIQDTHNCYNTCAAFMLEKAKSGYGSVVLATHNMESGRIAYSKASDLGLANRDSRVQFAQIKGMADGLSLALVRAGFRVSKYLAFGPLTKVLPYLIRRAEENRGMLRNTAMERKSIRQELTRRIMKI